MGLFNRSPRSDDHPRLDPQPTHEPPEETPPGEEPELAARMSEPAPESALPQPDEQPPEVEQPRAVEPEAVSEQEPVSEDAPPAEAAVEPPAVAAEEIVVKRAPEPQPGNTSDEEDDGRITASEALAPSRAHSADPAASGADQLPRRRAKVISFANQKGGVAKTTTTLNLAVAFAESGHDVLCIDLDPQGNLTMSQGIDPDKVQKSMFDVLVHHIPLREVIQEREIDIAVASIDLAGAEIAMSTQIGRERSLEKGIKAIEDDYDFICIDTPPSLGLLTVNALTASDKVIVPVQCEYLSMRGLLQLQNTVEMIRENLNPRLEIEGILPTMLDGRTVHAKEAVEILEENFGDLVFETRIRKTIKFAEAPVRGASVLKYDPTGNAAGYYRELAQEVLTNGAS